MPVPAGKVGWPLAGALMPGKCGVSIFAAVFTTGAGGSLKLLTDSVIGLVGAATPGFIANCFSSSLRLLTASCIDLFSATCFCTCSGEILVRAGNLGAAVACVPMTWIGPFAPTLWTLLLLMIVVLF